MGVRWVRIHLVRHGATALVDLRPSAQPSAAVRRGARSQSCFSIVVMNEPTGGARQPARGLPRPRDAGGMVQAQPQ